MMGGSCSLQRQRALHWNQQRRNNQNERNNLGSCRNGRQDARRSVRHCVDSEVPDHSIATLYPLDDNYVLERDNRRSPKSLVELCTDTVCRSLPDLDGELPPGLPQDVVNNIVHSLLKHSALNATTLRALKNCELGALSLAGCRGVTDDWLVPLSSRSPSASPVLSQLTQPENDGVDAMDLDDIYDTCPQNQSYGNLLGRMELQRPRSPGEVGYREIADESSSSCSTSSFVSASSTPYVASSFDHPMAETTNENFYKEERLSSPSRPSVSLEDFVMHGSEIPSIQITPVPSLTSNLTLLDLRGSQRLTDRGLLQLTDLGSLEVAKLDNCHSLVGRGLLAFTSSHRLHTLSLANCRRLTDEAVINISHLSSLEALSVDGCRCLTDRSLAAMSGLFALNKLDLSQCDLLTDDGMDHLCEMEFLEELSLGWCRSITDRGLETLTGQPGRAKSLRVLRLARCPITDDGIGHVGTLAALEELDLNGCSNVGSSALSNTLGKLVNLVSLDVSYCPGILRSSWQGKIKSLRTLELCYSGVRDAHLSRLVELPALEEINLDSCPVGDWAVAHLADNKVVPNLTSLDLADTDLSDLGMVHLPKFKNLTRLSLFYCNITNAGLRHLEFMTNLEVLNLDSREIGDDGLSHLRNLSHLHSLDIFSGRITDLGCTHISKIKSLESLELCGGGIGDLGCTLLATLDNLTSLNLSQNERITNRGAAALAALTNLKALNLSNTRVNAAALRYLSGLLQLQSLALYGCRGIENGSGLDNLRSELPSLKCLRLNSSSDDDGVVYPDPDGDDVESDSSSDDRDVQFADFEAEDDRNEPMAGRHDSDEEHGMEDDDTQSQQSFYVDDGVSIYSDHD